MRLIIRCWANDLKIINDMILQDIVSLLANRINQPHVIECYLRKVYAKGYETGTKQSLWISVKERLPKDFDPKLILLKDEQVRIALLDSADRNDFEIIYFWHDREADESFDLEDVVAWMPIPSFDEILEENRDVLERIKEKGD